ncbi:hypothetical protein [Streptomyces sp. NPDC005805]|uniref:hypothetical protein n=1 Tax=Streptomyces sp. NPDC005805 TaxID=3157068 RepID=UPI0033E8BE87
MRSFELLQPDTWLILLALLPLAACWLHGVVLIGRWTHTAWRALKVRAHARLRAVLHRVMRDPDHPATE